MQDDANAQDAGPPLDISSEASDCSSTRIDRDRGRSSLRENPISFIVSKLTP